MDEFDRVTQHYINPPSPLAIGYWASSRYFRFDTHRNVFEFGDMSNMFLTFVIQQGLLLYVAGKLDSQPGLLPR